MNAVIGLCHFCEAHGPRPLFCTFTTDNEHNTKESSKISVQCNGCTSLGPETVMVSRDEDGTIFCSRESVPNADVTTFLRQAAIRSITCEVCWSKEGGVVYFSDTQGHVLSLTFQLRDTRARGMKRWFSIVVLMKDKMLLLNITPFLSEHMQKIAKELQQLADIVYDEEQKVCSQRSLRLKTGRNDFGQSRSLIQLTGQGYNRGGWRGRPRGRGRGFMTRNKNTLKFDNDYDFEQANTEFEELRSQLAKTKISDGDVKPESALQPVEVDKKDDSGNETGAGEAELEEDSFPGYDKNKSFFDNISCEAVERSKGRSQRTDWRTERKLNSETFGVASARRGAWRGRATWRHGPHPHFTHSQHNNPHHQPWRSSRGGRGRGGGMGTGNSLGAGPMGPVSGGQMSRPRNNAPSSSGTSQPAHAHPPTAAAK